jgi:hypothetical protein
MHAYLWSRPAENVVTWKPSLIWQDNIKANLLEGRLGEMSQDQVQWLVFVNPPFFHPLKQEIPSISVETGSLCVS